MIENRGNRAANRPSVGMYRNGDVRHAACRPEETIRRLGWVPLTMAGEGIPKLCDWIDAELETAQVGPA